MRKICVVLLSAALLVGCGLPGRQGSGDDHGHGHGTHGHDDHHDHDDDHDHGHGDEAHTLWTERSELLVEHLPLVAGESTQVLVHVTELSRFRPVVDAEIVLRFEAENQGVRSATAEALQPGIYAAEITPERAGLERMSVHIEAEGFTDVHDLGIVTIHTAGSHPEVEAEEAGDPIAFTKEQQWALDFDVAVVAMRPVQRSLTVPAEVHPRIGGEVTLTAPVPGHIDSAGEVPHPGTWLREGQVIANILPGSDELLDAPALSADLAVLEEQRALAFSERERVKRLVAARALPSRRLDEASAELAAVDARLGSARVRWERYRALSDPLTSGPDGDHRHEVEISGPGYILRAPFDGVVIEAAFASGESVEQGQPLVRLYDPWEVHIDGLVPESAAIGLHRVTGGELIVADEPVYALGEPIVIGSRIDPHTRTAEISFAFDNRTARLPLGARGEVRLFQGDPVDAPAIPESALMDDAGIPVAYVQTGGESFERRMLRLGSRSAGYVQVLEGLELGERVVDRGAYLVRLAAAGDAAPSHGHVH